MKPALREAGILEGDPLDAVFVEIDRRLTEIADAGKLRQEDIQTAFYKAGMVVARRLAVRLDWWWALASAAAGGALALLGVTIGYLLH